VVVAPPPAVAAPPPVAAPRPAVAAAPPEPAVPPAPPADVPVPAPPMAPPEPLPPELTIETPPPPPSPPPEPAPEANPMRLGLMVGILSFPRPLEAEVVLKMGRWFGLGLEGSFLPTLRAPGDAASLDLKAVQGMFRWYPFGGAFFLGAGLGYQNFIGSLGQTVDGGDLQVSADMSGPYFAPQLGWMWITDSGFSVGVTLGLQVPIPREPVVSSTYNGQPVPGMPTASVSQNVIDTAHSNESSVRSIAKFIVRYPFPEIDLLRVGLFF